MKSKTATLLTFSIVFTWMNLLAILGASAILVQNISFNSVLAVLISIAIYLPVKNIYQNLETIQSDFESYLELNKYQISATAILFAVSALSFIYGISFPRSNILKLSFHASSQLFFPVKIFYANLIGEALSSIIFNYLRWYLQFLWIYLTIGLVLNVFEDLETFKIR